MVRRFQHLSESAISAVQRVIVAVALGVTLTGCSLDHLLNGDDQAEGTVIDPGTLTTYQGALTVYNSARLSMHDAMNSAIPDIGLMTDELTPTFGGVSELDSRYLSSLTTGKEGLNSFAYERFHAVRIRSAQAADLLRKYGTETSAALVGNAYAMQAYAIVMLAEMFCSGVPLTDVPFGGELKYTPGLSTTTLFERAVALFDTAYQYGKDSVPIATLAQVGKGRALLSLGRYTEAAEAVVNVAPNSAYRLSYLNQGTGIAFWGPPTTTNQYRILSPEGGNGIRWLALTPALQDKRVPVSNAGGVFVDPVRQQKYPSQTVTVTIADNIQARMITAEAQLQPADNPQGPWLATLNDARATIGLEPLADPGIATERIDLLFRERAFWFYLTGQRLGDMRRLVRHYGRMADHVYPAGAHPAGNPNYPMYGNEYVFVPDKTERDFNPLFTGCIDRRP